MKKKINQCFLVTILLMTVLSCRKSPDSSCYRMITYDYNNENAGIQNVEHYTYKDGLADNAYTTYGLRFSLEYNAQKKISGSKVYDGDSLVYIITLIYKNNKVAEEIWEYATTKEMYDHVFLTYGDNGKLLHSESFILVYAVDYTYYADRSLKSWFIVDHGIYISKGEYTYEDDYKNPETSISGVDYLFWYSNSGFGPAAGSKWYTSERITVYDENNHPIVLYEQDAKKTVWHMGQPAYPLQVDYIDKLTGTPIFNTFEYEACNTNVSIQSARVNTFSANKGSSFDAKNKVLSMLPQGKAIAKFRESRMLRK